MVTVKLDNAGKLHFQPNASHDKAVLMSFGFFDNDGRDIRSLDDWKNERTRLGLDGKVRMFIPA